MLVGTRRGTFRHRLPTVAVALFTAAVALATAPAFAAAAPFVVDGAGDAPKSVVGPICITTEGTCTLRAAIEASDAEPDLDTVTFDSGVFDRGPTAKIEPATALPPITEPAKVLGANCGNAQFAAPCVSVTAPANAAALTVEADGVEIDGIALGGGEAGIEVLGRSTGFRAMGDWFGFELAGGANEIQQAGIVLGPASDGAVIGDDEQEVAHRNVFGHSIDGVVANGASDTRILGNYFGVEPRGFRSSGLAYGVDVRNAPDGTKAAGNEIGGVLTPAEIATPACDGPCNVFGAIGYSGVAIGASGAKGFQPASGPTTIRGNYIGLAADGLRTEGGENYGVYAASGSTSDVCREGSSNITVGGTAPGEANYFDGGTWGVYIGGADNLDVLGNVFGRRGDGTEGEPSSVGGVVFCGEGVRERARIADNELLLGPNSYGILSDFGGADITGNSLGGGFRGITLTGNDEGHGDVVSGNIVAGPKITGIGVGNGSNVLTGNVITGAGSSGIEVFEGEGNRIGGDAPGEANTVIGTGGNHFAEEPEGAIIVQGQRPTRNEIASNFGSGNANAFIQLVSNRRPAKPNALAQPPAFASALQSSTSGTAQPGATVRVFRKAATEAGEIESLLAVGAADSSGHWSVAFPTVPVGTIVAATQTTDGGTSQATTSELTAPTKVVADPPSPATEGGGKSDDSTTPPKTPTEAKATPRVAPKVKILAGPKKSSASTTAKFRFKTTSSDGAKFECKLDGAKWARCTSPKTYRKLAAKKHAFRVRATADGKTGPATKFRFTVTG